MYPHNLTNGESIAPAGASKSAPTGVGVLGAQAALLDSNIQPQNHHLDQHPVEYAKHYQQQQQQHKPQGQFFSQPKIPKTDIEGQPLQPMPSVFPTNTNSTGTGDPGLHVGGVGVSGAQVERLPATLDTIEHARPPVRSCDPPTEASAPPMIQIQREDSMRGYSTLPPTGQYNPRQTVPYDPQIPYLNGGNINMASSSTTTTTTTNAPPKIHTASAEVITAADAANDDDDDDDDDDAQTRGRRRSSLAILADKFLSASRSHSREASRSSSISGRLSRTLSWTLSDEEENEPTGPYANVKKAQDEYITKLRAEQERNHITTNADGLPIPPQQQHRRRSSVAHVLGFDKPLLSR
ncbi:hypothetical protein BGZ59_010265 [Podila verticillata]|nr:hypothetical protein BGZ59_010265 [Podila verticillata]